MFIIRNVEVLEVNKSIHEIMNSNKENHAIRDMYSEINPIQSEIIQSEIIHGHTFLRHINGVTEEWVIGLDKKTKDLLKIPMDSIDNMNKTIESNRIKINEMKTHITFANNKLVNEIKNNDTLVNMNLWNRIIFLFSPLRALINLKLKF